MITVVVVRLREHGARFGASINQGGVECPVR